MSDVHLPAEACFKQEMPLTLDGGGDDLITVAELFNTSRKYITIYETDLSIAEARQLRDWLNKVLP